VANISAGKYSSTSGCHVLQTAIRSYRKPSAQRHHRVWVRPISQGKFVKNLHHGKIDQKIYLIRYVPHLYQTLIHRQPFMWNKYILLACEKILNANSWADTAFFFGYDNLSL